MVHKNRHPTGHVDISSSSTKTNVWKRFCLKTVHPKGGPTGHILRPYLAPKMSQWAPSWLGDHLPTYMANKQVSKRPQKVPKESNTDRGKQENAFGKDPLGRKGMKNDDNESSRLRPKFKGGSPLAMEQREMLKKVPGPQRTGKQLVFEQEKKGNDLLDENQLK